MDNGYKCNLLVCLKADVAGRAVNKAHECGGSVRLISRSDDNRDSANVDAVLRDVHDNQAALLDEMSGLLQAWGLVQSLIYRVM